MTDSIPHDDTPVKQCSNPACKRWLPATPEYFQRLSRKKDGLNTRCKQCVSEQKKEYYNRPDVHNRILAQVKDYYNRPGIHEQRLEYKRVYSKIYQERTEVQEKRRVRCLDRYFRQRDIPGSYTVEQIQDLLKRQKHKCYYCATKFKQVKGKHVYHIDHTFPLNRATGDDPINDISYLVLACPRCNISKNNKYPWEFPEGGKLL